MPTAMLDGRVFFIGVQREMFALAVEDLRALPAQRKKIYSPFSKSPIWWNSRLLRRTLAAATESRKRPVTQYLAWARRELRRCCERLAEVTVGEQTSP